MHPFSIDFITGNTASFYNKEFTLDNETENQDTLQEQSANDSYFNTTQNLEDIYSVISQDTALSTRSTGHENLIQNQVAISADHVLSARYQETMYLIHNQHAASKDAELSTRSPESINESTVSRGTHYVIQNKDICEKDSVLTTRSIYSDFLIQNNAVITSADDSVTARSPGSDNVVHIISEGSPEPEYLVQSPDSLERGTPSPTQDSGIDSTGSSPQVSDQSSEDVSRTLEDLEKKATKVTNSTKTTEKPGLSYIALIAQAILSTPDNKMTLGDIYKHIRDNHGYYDNEERAWRNSIRYNLSINECFIKAGKEESGKGNYWAIHPICQTDFAKGDYRRRQARRRARRGTRTLDLDMAQPPRNIAYTAMTPSFLGYHPYGSTGMVPAHPYRMTSQAQMYQSHSSVFAPTSTANLMQGKPMYTGSPAYASYSNFMPVPYGYMGNQKSNYQTSDTNAVVIQ